MQVCDHVFQRSYATVAWTSLGESFAMRINIGRTGRTLISLRTSPPSSTCHSPAGVFVNTVIIQSHKLRNEADEYHEHYHLIIVFLQTTSNTFGEKPPRPLSKSDNFHKALCSCSDGLVTAQRGWRSFVRYGTRIHGHCNLYHCNLFVVIYSNIFKYINDISYFIHSMTHTAIS